MNSELRELNTTSEVIDALGGITKTAALTGRKYSAAHNWKNFVKFPADTYVVMQEALAAGGYSAPSSLWGMVQSPTTQPDHQGAEVRAS